MRRSVLFLCVLRLTTAAWAAPAPLELSAAERAWIAAHPVIQVGLPDNLGPFSFTDTEHGGQLAGLSVDLLELVTQRTGLRFQQHVLPGITPAIEGVGRYELDLVMGIGRTPEREQLVRYGVPYAFSPDAIVSRTDTPFLFDVSVLGGHRVGLARSSAGLQRDLQARVPDAELVLYERMSDAVRAVSRGEVFVAVTDASVAAFTAKQERLTNVRISGLFNESGDIHYGGRKDWPELISLLDKVVTAMPASERVQLANRWVVLDYESDQRWKRASTALGVVLAMGAVLLAAALYYGRKRAAELEVRRRIQLELERTRDELARASHEKTELLRMVAHDLRNPLSAMTMCTELLSLPGGTEPGELAATLGNMRDAQAQMSQLTNALVDLQALEEGHRRWQPSRFEVGAVARAAVAAAQETAGAKRQRLTLSVAEGLPPVDSDEGALRRVLDNLVSNALKYSPADTVVEVTVQGGTGGVQARVKDQGPGLSAEDRARVFEKYRTGQARPTGGESSTGLGLWIVARLVEEMRGKVWCESELGAGATFICELPLKR